MVSTYQNLLSKEELGFLDSLCLKFVETNTHSTKTKYNYYIRKVLDIEKDLLEYQKCCRALINDDYELFGLWINKVTEKTNIDDDFHNDEADLTIITYINEDFEGGEFEYFLKDKEIKITPKINHTIMLNKKIKHRVLNVISGCRFSLISFYRTIKKEEKTLI